MAITKEDAKTKLTDKDRREIQACEAFIDARIEEDGFEDGQRIIIDIASLQTQIGITIREKITKAIIKLYTDAGWSVKLDHAQREGSWLEFS